MTTGRRTGRPPKAPEARSPLRGRGTAQVVHVGASDHAQLLAELGRGDLADAIGSAVTDALWLRRADRPAIELAQLIARELTRDRSPAPPVDEVGTVGAFADPPSPPPVREYGPLLVGLLSDLGMTPQARVRLSIRLVEEEPPAPPRPMRLPRAAR